jgi:hypothetical protein
MSWNKCKSIINVRSSFQISQMKILVSYSRTTYVNVNMFFIIVILKETLVLMCLARHFVIIESLKLIVEHRVIYYAKKILNFFIYVEFRILVEKWNVYEGHTFLRPQLQTCRLETTSLSLNTRLLVNKYFQILIIFIEININVCLLCDHHVMKSIILHTRRSNCQ